MVSHRWCSLFNLQGVAQLFSFPYLNTHCLDVMQGQSAEATAANYVIRYAFAALGFAFCLPTIERIGVGGFSNISAGLLPNLQSRLNLDDNPVRKSLERRDR